MKPLLNLLLMARPIITERCIKALLNHTDRSKFEWVVVDQNAIPEVKELISKYEEEFDGVLVNDFNVGGVFAHNQGIALRKPGQTYIILDDDVIMQAEDWLELLMKALTYKDIGSATCVRSTFWIDAPGRKEFFYHDIKDEERDPDFWAQISPPNSGIVGPAWAIRGNVLDELGYFNEHSCNYDGDMPVRISMAGYKNAYVPQAVIEQPQSENTHPQKHVGKALYQRGLGIASTYTAAHMRGKELSLESRFGGWVNAEPYYIRASDANWEFCKNA